MRNRLKLLLGHKRWLIVLAVAIVAVVAYLVITGHWVNPLSKNLEVHISVQSATVTKDRFLVVNGELRNHTVHSYGAPWGTCAQQIAYYMDGKQIYSEGYGAQCAIGYGDIKPGEVFKETFTVDPSAFSNGKHSFYVLYEDSTKSNALTLNITSPATVSSCYDLTQYASPLCSQISVVSDVSDSGDKTRCETYLDYLSKNTPLKPIVPLSSVNCVEKDSAVPYLVMNVPKNDPDQWVAKLSDHFSYTNLPSDYASVTLVKYPQ